MLGKDISYIVTHYIPDEHASGNYRQESKIYYKQVPPSIDPTQYVHTQMNYYNPNDPDHRIFCLGIDYAPPGFALKNRCANLLVVNCVIDGKGTFNGRPFSKGDCYYSRPGQIYSMIADSQEPWVSVWFCVDGVTSNQLCERLDSFSDNQFLPMRQMDELFRFADFYLHHLGTICQSDDFLHHLLFQLLTFVTPEKKSEEKEAFKNSERLRVIVKQSILYIQNNLSTVTVKELARQAHLEHKYFTRVFNNIVGSSPQNYILKVKMNMAAHYLTKTSYSVEKISELLGYKHHNGLAIAFKNAFGMSPADFRNRHK